MIFNTFSHAVGSVISCLLQPRQERPKTVLRSLCVAAFDFAAWANGQPLGRDKRRTLGRFLDLGALINDHFDQHRFQKQSYRRLRKLLAADKDARAAYRAYFRALRRVERNRPPLRLSGQSRILEPVAAYREDVVRLSLGVPAAIAFGPPDRADFPAARPPAAEDPRLPHLFALAMLFQIGDDLLDWRADWRARLPSFATAALLQSELRAESGSADLAQVRADIQRIAARYLAAAPAGERTYWPLVLSTYVVWLLVKPLSMFAVHGMHRWKRPARPYWKFRWPLLDVGPSECRKNVVSLED
jgi:hypothetical protein